jgi:hypothetical protein
MKAKAWIGVSIITVLAIGNALPAFAKSTRIVVGGVTLATADFSAYGDVFHVEDKAKDGRGAYVHWSNPASGRSGNCDDINGSGNGPTTCNYNFPENTQINWHLCVKDNGGSQTKKCVPKVYDGT